ncbi:MAG: Uncharacterized protein XD64_0265 [Thermotoga sp. 47_83]|uniref:DUF2905 domain-containing protein n=3 Tax=Thermotoga TaxID=2335 RepID=Q9WZN1_THEMA|nr:MULTISPECIES: DUF2905 domain-containing protein [Thermotoga]KUK23579.1 MAG: Uncharacterized protein XD57_0333 [Thermotoga petrophila]KUK33896.1 MAG: Uncharacterized protein XD64_0265 [Thermotoga sp. 47_83]MBZ4662061.1 hypothetical protein [Thermotoga sp.]AAD35855.1 hypothetical protein TM_0773 [Thermotoga maritima MSB8]ABQ46184.1 hypothetical protein Tpet_0155 [Thermotoga petrophila RKU-1]
MFQGIGKFLILMGLILVAFGILLILFERIPFLGKLPGDIVIKRKNFVFYFPLMTSLIISLLVSFILYLISRMR